MGTGTEAEWTAFVASTWPGLVRTATLLGGDPAAADAHAAAALLRTRRQVRSRHGGQKRVQTWSQRARRNLLTPPGTPGGRLRALIRGPGSPAVRGSDPLLRRYRALAPRRRALLVLTVADGLDVAAAAGVLGLSTGRAAEELAAAVDGLRGPGPDELGPDRVVELDLGDLPRGADATTGADALLGRDPLVDDLRDAFAGLAAGAPAEDDGPRRLYLASIADRRSRQRHAAVAAFLFVAVVATTLGVVRENARIQAERQRTAREVAANAALHPTVLSRDVSSWPTRGSRGTDARLLADVGARVGGRPEVLFAGNVAGVDVVVALTGPGDAPLLHVLAGPPGTTVDTWREAGAGLLVGPGGVPAVSAAVADDQGRLHVLTVTLTSGVTVAYSPAPVLADDAAISRRYFRLPLVDGIGTALVAARPEHLRMRVDGGGFDAIVAPLVVPGPARAAEAVPVLRAPVTRTASCDRSPQVDDVPDLVREATRNAGLAVPDVTGVRMLWCREDAQQGEAAVALTAARGPDIQCYETVERAADGVRTTSSQCWPVPRRAGATAAFLAPDVAIGGAPANVLALSVFAPAASTAEVRAWPPGSVPVARARVAADGYVRFAVPVTADTPRDVLESEGVVSLLDARGDGVGILSIRSRNPVDVWGEGAHGPVVER